MFFTTGAQLQAAINALPTTKVGSFTAFDAFFYGQQYMSAGKYTGTLSPIEHFVQIGAAQGNKPSASFDPSFYAAKYADLTNKGFDAADLLIHFLRTGLDEGRAPNASLAGFDGAAYLAAYPDVATYVNANLASFGGSATNGAIAHYVKFGQAQGFTLPGSVVNTFNLATTADMLAGTTGNDTFNARIFDNQNTLQSGDVVNGGPGTNDRLNADVGNSQKFAITAETTGVEVVSIRAQATAIDTNDNNLSTNIVQIDAQRMAGVNQWESSNSRADVVIEDVRIATSQITKDITVAMVETDPGHVDFGLYFDQYSLRNTTTSSTTLTLQIMDTRSNASDNTKPLENSPYNGFAFTIGGVLTTVQSTGIDDAKTYDAMVTAINAALKTAKQGDKVVDLSATFVASKGSNFTVSDTLGSLQTGSEIQLKSTSGEALGITAAGTGWIANGAVPASSGLHTKMDTAAVANTDLVTSTVVLDDVGRGSTAGDLVIGGLSVGGATGGTSSSLGVQRFEIEVRDNSKLESINSTNNTLREVTIKNGLTSSGDFAYQTTTKDKGNLTVNGNSGVNGANVTNTLTTDEFQGKNVSLPGAKDQIEGGFGFSDVRLIDATKFDGKLEFSAEVTSKSIAKYLNLTDIAALPAGDNVAFAYTGGANADTMYVQLDSKAAASRSNIMSGREDFTFAVNGGAGDDKITLIVSKAAVAGLGLDWQNNQDLNNNITVDGGDGNDIIRTPGAGDVTINAGAGSDTVYTDNTGGLAVTLNTVVTTAAKAQFVFNTLGQNSTENTVVLAARQIDDLRSGANDSYNLYKATLVVKFKDLPSVTVTLANSSTYKTTDLEINQAIKNAINTDATLKMLLVAKDGPANTLVVESLIDGEMATTDLVVTLSAPTGTAGALSAAELAAANTAWGTTHADSATALTAQATIATNFGTFGDYTAQFGTADNGTAKLTGADSTVSSDNIVTPGSGNDVIVLGTDSDGNGQLVLQSAASNDVVVYGAGFGSDVIVNFEQTGAGIDFLNFAAFLGTATPTVATTYTTATNSLVTVQTVAATVNDTAALVSAIVKTADTAVTVAATKQVFVVVTAHNVGSVYSVANGLAIGDATATLEGTIDLADTTWGSLTAANFTIPTVTQYGASKVQFDFVATGSGQTITGTANADTISNGGFATVTLVGNGGNDVFTVTTNAATITDLNSGDTVNTGGQIITSTALNLTGVTVAGGGSFVLTGTAAADTIVGSSIADTITGGAGADTINGGAGQDVFVFAAGDSNSTATDVITGYATTEQIDHTVLNVTANSTVVASAAGKAGLAGAGAAATFNGADNSLALHIIAIEAALADTTHTAGEAAHWQEGADAYVFITDGVAGVGANDVIVKLVGVDTTNAAFDVLTITANNLTLA